MKFGYKDLLEGQPCCESCDNQAEVEFDGHKMIYCPLQEQIVINSGHCDAYDGFWTLIKG